MFVVLECTISFFGYISDFTEYQPFTIWVVFDIFKYKEYTIICIEN